MKDTVFRDEQSDPYEELYDSGCKLLKEYEPEKARVVFQSILDADNHYYRAINKLGVILAGEKKLDAARDMFESCLELKPDYAPALVNSGNICKENRNQEAAIDFYLKAIAADESYHFSYYNLAVTYKSMGKLDLYLQYLKKYRRHYRNHTIEGNKIEALQFKYKNQLLIVLVLVFLLIVISFR
jgi:tetratricopeptide (TPR) repeat protein